MRRWLVLVLVLLVLTVAVHASPGSAAMQEGLQIWHQGDSNRYPEVLSAFRRALTYDPQNADYHCKLGQALLDAGDLQTAFNELRWTLAWHPWSRLTQAEAHLGLGQIWEARRHPAYARQEYLKAEHLHVSHALTLEAAARERMTHWPRLTGAHVVLVTHPGAVADAPSLLSAAEQAAEASRRGTGASIDERILVYVLGSGDAKPGVPSDGVREGRQQIYLTAGNVSELPRDIARVVSWHIAPQHSTDPVVREGYWRWLLTSDPTTLHAATTPLDQLRDGPWTDDTRDTAAAFVQYLIQTYGQDAFRQFWSSPSSSKGALDAFKKSLPDLEAEWRAASH
ncbi:MAG: tetratricopeptide repeat protein [Candidatus Xenobia bacterium]